MYCQGASYPIYSHQAASIVVAKRKIEELHPLYCRINEVITQDNKNCIFFTLRIPNSWAFLVRIDVRNNKIIYTYTL